MRKNKSSNKQMIPQIIFVGMLFFIVIFGSALSDSVRGMLYSSVTTGGYLQTVSTREAPPKPVITKIFTDIPSTNPFAGKLQYLKDQKIMGGYGDGSFKPLNPMNRAEFIKTLVNAKNDSPIQSPQTNCFKDIHNEWYAPYVCDAKKEGWIKGYSDNTFRPATSINRAEALKIFVNVYDLDTAGQAPDQNLSDFPKTQWYTPYVWTAGQDGLITDWSSANKTGGLSPKDMGAAISRLDVATTIYQLETTEEYPLPEDMTCDYEAFKGDGGAAEAAKQFPPKDKYDIERTGMSILSQDDYGAKTCFPTTAGMSFTWLKSQGQGFDKLVNNGASGSPDINGMIDELKKDMDWNEDDGSNSAQAVSGIAKYLKDHGLADKFTIEFITKAPKNGKFPLHDALDGKTSLDGVGFSMGRRAPKGSDVVDQMKKGQDVIIGINGHVIEIAGIDEKPNAKGNYDVKLAEPALGTTLGAEITPEGKLKVGDKLTNIQDLLAVSPKK